MSTISERIKLIRKENNLNQTQFGEKIGVNRDAISNIELNRNKNGVPDNIIKLISITFNVDEHWLRTGEGKMPNSSNTFSLDKFLQEKDATELEIDIIKIYMNLDKNIRKKLMADLKKAVLKDNEFSKNYKMEASEEISPEYKDMSIDEMLEEANKLETLIEKKRMSLASQEQNENLKENAQNLKIDDKIS